MQKRLSRRAREISPSATLAIDTEAKQMAAAGIDVISFGSGEPDFNTPDHIGQAGIDAIREGFTRYTASDGIIELRQAVCHKFKRDNNLDYSPNQIVVSNGAKQSLYNALQILVEDGDEVLVPVPYWVSYPEMVKLAGANPVLIKTRASEDFKLQVADIEAALTANTRALILNGPSNPSGMAYSEAELKAIAAACLRHNLFVISDEIYEELVYDGTKHHSIATVEPKIKDMTIVVNGLSKAYAMTGWRIGYAAAHPMLAKAMADLQSHSTSNANSIAQKAAIAALAGSQEPVGIMVRKFSERRDYMVGRINNIKGLSCRKPEGAFYVMATVRDLFGTSLGGETIKDDMHLAALLLSEAHVAVVPGTAFGAPGFIRLSYATSMEKIKAGLNRIDKFING